LRLERQSLGGAVAKKSDKKAGKKKRDKQKAAAANGTRSAKSLGKGEYLERIGELQLQLDDLTRWLKVTGRRLLVLIEGRDTAGKSGSTRANAASSR
jgi:polyphosphate kinase